MLQNIAEARRAASVPVMYLNLVYDTGSLFGSLNMFICLGYSALLLKLSVQHHIHGASPQIEMIPSQLNPVQRGIS
jgi:hypothetical protein